MKGECQCILYYQSVLVLQLEPNVHILELIWVITKDQSLNLHYCLIFGGFVIFIAYKKFITFLSHQESNLGPQDCELFVGLSPDAVTTRLYTYLA